MTLEGRRRHSYTVPTSDPSSSPTTKAEGSLTTEVPTVESIIDMYGERPLPPVPAERPRAQFMTRHSSHESTFTKRSIATLVLSTYPPSPPPTPAHTRFVTQKDLVATHESVVEKHTRTADVLDVSVKHVQVPQKAELSPSHAVKPAHAKAAPFTEWKAPPYRKPPALRISRLSQIPPKSESPNATPRQEEPALKSEQKDYFSLLPAGSALSPAQPSDSSSENSTPSRPFLSPRIVDVTADVTDCCLPLSAKSSSSQNLLAKRHLSESHATIAKVSSGSPETVDPEGPHPIEGRLELVSNVDAKSGHSVEHSRTKSAPEVSLEAAHGLGKSDEDESLDLQNHEHKNPGRMHGPNELPQHMRLPKVGSSSTRALKQPDRTGPTFRPRPPNSTKKPPPKEVRNPAIPLSEYQKYGPKIWEHSSTSWKKRLFGRVQSSEHEEENTSAHTKQHRQSLPGDPSQNSRRGRISSRLGDTRRRPDLHTRPPSPKGSPVNPPPPPLSITKPVPIATPSAVIVKDNSRPKRRFSLRPAKVLKQRPPSSRSFMGEAKGEKEGKGDRCSMPSSSPSTNLTTSTYHGQAQKQDREKTSHGPYHHRPTRSAATINDHDGANGDAKTNTKTKQRAAATNTSSVSNSDNNNYAERWWAPWLGGMATTATAAAEAGAGRGEGRRKSLAERRREELKKSIIVIRECEDEKGEGLGGGVCF